MSIVIGILAVAAIAYLWGFSDGCQTGKGTTIVREDKHDEPIDDW